MVPQVKPASSVDRVLTLTAGLEVSTSMETRYPVELLGAVPAVSHISLIRAAQLPKLTVRSSAAVSGSASQVKYNTLVSFPLAYRKVPQLVIRLLLPFNPLLLALSTISSKIRAMVTL